MQAATDKCKHPCAYGADTVASFDHGGQIERSLDSVSLLLLQFQLPEDAEAIQVVQNAVAGLPT